MSARTSGGVHNRRKLALQRLEDQLKLGKKPLQSTRSQKGPRVMEDLLPNDIKKN